MSKHTKEQVPEGNAAQFPMPSTPWKATNFWIFDNNELPITTVDSVWFPSRTREATAKRIVECVNALDGVEGNVLLFIELMKSNYNVHTECLTKLEQSHNDNAVLTDLLLRIAQRLDASNIEILQDINDTLEGLNK